MYYKIDRKDGGVAIMLCEEGTDPQSEIAKWHPDLRAEVVPESATMINESEIVANRKVK